MALNVEFDELRDKADELRTNADEIMDVIKDSKSILEALVGDGFDGATANAFIEKFDDLTPSLEAAAELLEGIGNTLEQSADTFEEADESMASNVSGS